MTPDLIGNLATFLITGKDPTGAFQPVAEPGKAEATKAVEPQKLAPPPAIVDPRQPTFDVSTGMSAGRVASFTLLGVGAAAILVGVIAWSSGDEARHRLEGITGANGKLPLANLMVGQEAIGLLASVDTNRALSFTLIGGGAGAIIAGALGLVLFPSGTTSVGLTPHPGGASLQVTGRF